jgi:hypothetical protein
MEAVSQQNSRIEDETLGERLALMMEGEITHESEQDIIDDINIRKKAQEILDAQQPCGTYDLSLLPGHLQDCCNEICKSTEAEPIMVLQSVLATVSALIKTRIRIREGVYFQTLYPVLWLLSITDSGFFKSTGINKGSRLAYEREKEVREQIEIIEQNDREKINLARQRSALLPNRTTGEALLEHLSNNHGGMIICTEFGEWLENLEKSHNKGLKALLTDLYDVPQHYGYSTRGNLTYKFNQDCEIYFRSLFELS